MTIDHVYEREKVYVVFEGEKTIGLHYDKDSAEGKEIAEYLIKKPDTLVSEPKIQEPTQAEKDVQEIQSLLAYLSSTDWYVIREKETNKSITSDILTNRQKARKRISKLRGEK